MPYQNVPYRSTSDELDDFLNQMLDPNYRPNPAYQQHMFKQVLKDKQQEDLNRNIEAAAKVINTIDDITSLT